MTSPAGSGVDESWSPAAQLETLTHRGEEPAIYSVADGDLATTSSASLAALSFGVGKALIDAGVGRGEVVAIHAANGVAWTAAGLGCGWVGAIFAPMDAAISFGEALGISSGLGAKVLLTDETDLETESLECELSVICLDNLRPVARADAPDRASIEPDDPIAIFRTSGTTGPPKKFHLTLRNIGFNVESAVSAGLVSSQDRVLMPLPMHHIFPWVVGTLVALSAGTALVLPKSLTGPDMAEALRIGRPTVLVGVPKLFETILSAIRSRFGGVLRPALRATMWLHSAAGLPVGKVLFRPIIRMIAPDLRLLISGGARLEATTAEQLEALGWEVRSGYGLSETAAIFTAQFGDRRPGTAGPPIDGCEIRIANPSAEDVGEVLLRGPNVFAGYIDNPEENARAFTPDGWFRSGDLGRLDGAGHLVITGRAKEVIVLGGGENIYPEDVERRYETSDDIVEIGVLEHDGALHALIVPNVAEMSRKGIMRPEDAVKVAVSNIASKLPSTMRLSGFRLTPEPLPRTHLGKLRRFLLADLYQQAAETGGASRTKPPNEQELEWIAVEPRASVWAILSEERPNIALGLDSHLELDLGFDSFGWMTLAVRLEQATGVRLDSREIARISTVRDLLEAVSVRPSVSAVEIAATRTKQLERNRRWIAPRNWFQHAIGATLYALIGVLMRWIYRLEVEGAERLPSRGALLICPNHVSDLDPPAIAAALPAPVRKRVTWAADAVRVFQVSAYRLFCRSLKVFPVDERMPLGAVDLAIEVLRRDDAQVWFPEGWRSADGKLLRFQEGVGRVVKSARPLVVPVYIEGALDAWPRDRRLPHLSGRVRVIFGAPVSPDDLAPSGNIEEATPGEIAAALRLRVAELARANGVDVL